jgi:hypothetical protein
MTTTTPTTSSAAAGPGSSTRDVTRQVLTDHRRNPTDPFRCACGRLLLDDHVPHRGYELTIAALAAALAEHATDLLTDAGVLAPNPTPARGGV